MSDTKPAVEAAVANPAEATKGDAQVDSTPEAKAEGQNGKAAEVAKPDTADAKTKEKATTDGKPAEGEESSTARSDEKASGAEKERDGDDRRGNRKGDRYDRGTKRGGGRYDNQRNKKRRSDKPNEFADLPETDDPVEIRQQVEFYFSAHNLRTDEHMFEEIDGANNRPVSIKHLTTFKRMRRFQPYSAVVAALRESDQLVVVDEGKFAGTGNEGVQRKEPLIIPTLDRDEKYKPSISELHDRLKKQSRNSLECSIYVKGFGDEDAAGQIALEKFFKPYGVVGTRKRRDEDDKWKGSVFVEFESEDAQKQFLDLDPKPKFNGNELTIMSKKDYVEMKCKEKGITPSWEKDGKSDDRRGSFHHRGGRGGGRGRGGRGRGRGRYNDRSDRRDRGRDRSRSPHERRYRRDRSGSRGSQDSRDWNGRRDKFQKSRDFKGGRRGEKRDSSPAAAPKDPSNPWNIEKDERGIPVVQDTTGQPDGPSQPNKRKADGGGRETSPKKTKIEIKEDE